MLVVLLRFLAVARLGSAAFRGVADDDTRYLAEMLSCDGGARAVRSAWINDGYCAWMC